MHTGSQAAPADRMTPQMTPQMATELATQHYDANPRCPKRQAALAYCRRFLDEDEGNLGFALRLIEMACDDKVTRVTFAKKVPTHLRQLIGGDELLRDGSDPPPPKRQRSGYSWESNQHDTVSWGGSLVTHSESSPDCGDMED